MLYRFSIKMNLSETHNEIINKLCDHISNGDSVVITINIGNTCAVKYIGIYSKNGIIDITKKRIFANFYNIFHYGVELNKWILLFECAFWTFGGICCNDNNGKLLIVNINDTDSNSYSLDIR